MTAWRQTVHSTRAPPKAGQRGSSHPGYTRGPQAGHPKTPSPSTLCQAPPARNIDYCEDKHPRQGDKPTGKFREPASRPKRSKHPYERHRSRGRHHRMQHPLRRGNSAHPPPPHPLLPGLEHHQQQEGRQAQGFEYPGRWHASWTPTPEAGKTTGHKESDDAYIMKAQTQKQGNSCSTEKETKEGQG